MSNKQKRFQRRLEERRAVREAVQLLPSIETAIPDPLGPLDPEVINQRVSERMRLQDNHFRKLSYEQITPQWRNYAKKRLL